MLLWIMAVRWRQASGPRRRSLAPVALVAAVLVVAYVVREALRGGRAEPAADRRAGPGGRHHPDAVAAGVPGRAGPHAGWTARRSATSPSSSARPLPPGRLEQALARALHDPTLQLAYWLPDRDGFVDAEGRPVELPAGGGDRGRHHPAPRRRPRRRPGPRRRPRRRPRAGPGGRGHRPHDDREPAPPGRGPRPARGGPRLPRPHRRVRRRRAPPGRAQPARRRPAAAGEPLARPRDRPLAGADHRPMGSSRRRWTRQPPSCGSPWPSCASWPAASTR